MASGEWRVEEGAGQGCRVSGFRVRSWHDVRDPRNVQHRTPNIQRPSGELPVSNAETRNVTPFYGALRSLALRIQMSSISSPFPSFFLLIRSPELS